MIVTTSEVYAILNLSTSVNTYENLIDFYIPIVTEDIMQIANHRYHDSYKWLYDNGLTFSTGSTLTLKSDSTEVLTKIFKAGDTLDVQGSYLNDGLYIVSTVGTTQLSVTTAFESESSTDYDITTMIYKCRYDWDIKRIASKMIWYNVTNTTSYKSGDIASESLGSYSVSYKDTGENGYGLYPSGLISGIKRVMGSM